MEVPAGTGPVKQTTALSGRRKTARVVFTALLVLVFAGGVYAGYQFFARGGKGISAGRETAGPEEVSTAMKVYYPVSGHLEMEERSVPAFVSKEDAAAGVIREFLKGPAEPGGSLVPANVKLLGAYLGADGILYADFSEELRSSFQGDAVAEFLLLRGLYESLTSNMRDLSDVRILIEGKEIETLGGHFSARMPLGDTVAGKRSSGAEEEEEAGKVGENE